MLGIRQDGMNLPSKFRRVLHLAGWNALLLIAGLALVALIGEAWLRSTVPFRKSYLPTVFVPGVGRMRSPDTEIRYTNHLDFWTVSRTNSLGFLDREPPSPERAAKGCHITMIGDSFVEAREVFIPEKFHVRLEEMAARELPHLDVTTSAFGRRGTGQISQLAFYDEYARHLRPKLIVLIFTPNDYCDNFPLWRSIRSGLDPEHLPYVSAVRTEDGSFRLRPPDPDYERFRLPRLSGSPSARSSRAFICGTRAFRASWFLALQCTKWALLFNKHEIGTSAQSVAWVKLLSRRPAYAPLLDGWQPVSRGNVQTRPANEDPPSFFPLFRDRNLPPFYREALAFTAFGLDEFKERAERDGVGLVILATHKMSYSGGGGAFARMNELAAERRIPVVHQADFIYRQGAELRDAELRYNPHWSPAGHQWAAEALLEYLKRKQDVCE